MSYDKLDINKVPKQSIVDYIPIEVNILNLIQRYWYELTGLTDLIVQFTSDTDMKPDENRYKLLLGEYMEAYTLYNLLYDQIVNEVATKYNEMITLNKYTTMIDFVKQSLVIIDNNGGM